MRIIKPYGRSAVQQTENGAPRERQIERNEAAGSPVQPIAALLGQAEPMLRQWLSIIDKIIAKPAAVRETKNIADTRKKEKLGRENKEKEKIRQVREILGQAVWEYLEADKLFPPDIEAEQKKKLRAYWDSKIGAAAVKQGKREDFPKGKLYRLFVDEREWQDIDKNRAETIVDKIYRHLHEKAYKIVPQNKAGADRARYGHKQPSKQDKRAKSGGLIADRARAIAANVLQPRRVLANTDFSEQDIDRYREKLRSHNGGADLAAHIRQAVLAEQEKAKDKEPAYNIAVGELRAIWPVIFGEAKKYAEAQEADKALLAVHNAVKEAYKQRLKGKPLFVDKQKPLVQGAEAKDKLKKLVCDRLERLLPDNDDKLFALLRNRRKNRDISHLIRLGKIIHYTAADKARAAEAYETDFAGDKTAFITNAANWPSVDEVENSRYWGSAGQTEIKQNEAFVRVWRRALAFAARTVKDWVDPNNNIAGDILIAKDKALSADRFNAAKAELKYNLLFADDGDKSDKKPSIAQQDWCFFALKALYSLRNAAFHFKGMGEFVGALQKMGKLREITGKETEEEKAKKEAENNIIKAVCPVLTKRYQQHRQKYQERLKDRLENIQLAFYLGGADIGFLWQKIAAGNASLLPLPRLRRVLERAEKAWKGGKQGKASSGKLLPEIALPDYVPAQNREGEEGEAVNCQWTVLKLLYDSAFKTWLDTLSYDTVQKKYIDEAIARATKAARNLNGKNAKGEPKSAEELALTVSRNDGFYRLQPGDTIETFFYQLTAATATEMRVQNHYESNGAKAREQAAYIEDLKCDVVALALADYLQFEDERQKKSFAFVLEIPQRKKTENPSIDVHKQLDNVPEKTAPQLWQAVLYFLLHLMPVEEVSSLRQQIRKYQIIVQKPESRGAVADEKRPHLQHGSEQEIAAQLVQVLDLYIFMHDAQFMVAGKGEGGQLADLLKQDYAEYYEKAGDFDTVFPQQEGQENPQAFRDLREMQRFGSKVLRWLAAKDVNAYKVRHDSVKELFPVLENEQEQKQKRKELKEKIAQAQKDRTKLHEKWADSKDKKQWERDNGQLYKELVRQIGAHQRLTAEVTLQNHVRLHRLLMAILGRLVDFSGLFERDLYFTLLALLYEKGVTDIAAEFKDSGELLAEGNYKALWQLQNPIGIQIKDEIIQKFFGVFDATLKKNKLPTEIRNHFVHLKILEVPEADEISWHQGVYINLTAEANKARQLMAYDRKLKNAVTKSLIELLEREGLELCWQMNNEHELHSAEVKAKQISHLGGAKLIDKKGKDGKPEKEAIMEPRHGKAFICMARALFAGGA